jgi:hypothetical protein
MGVPSLRVLLIMLFIVVVAQEPSIVTIRLSIQTSSNMSASVGNDLVIRNCWIFLYYSE